MKKLNGESIDDNVHCIFNRNKFRTWWKEIFRNSFYFLFSLVLLKSEFDKSFLYIVPRTI